MPADRHALEQDPRTAAERLLARKLEGAEGAGRPFSARALRTARSVEAYLEAGGRPRWMERVIEVDHGIAEEKRRLEHAYRDLQAACAEDVAGFAERWIAFARSRRFDGLNELIGQHNDWYPMERDLAVDPRTRDYVLVNGRSYRRPVLGPEWVLEHFPAWPAGG